MTENALTGYIHELHTLAARLPRVVSHNIVYGIVNYLIEAERIGANPEDEFFKCKRLVDQCIKEFGELEHEHL